MEAEGRGDDRGRLGAQDAGRQRDRREARVAGRGDLFWREAAFRPHDGDGGAGGGGQAVEGDGVLAFPGEDAERRPYGAGRTP